MPYMQDSFSSSSDSDSLADVPEPEDPPGDADVQLLNDLPGVADVDLPNDAVPEVQ